ncbi:MAG: GntR family transcriptional regulator [Clostridiales bacterium]|jgi:DNA-binding GntR family transcriptional regulator|nr:GntR family transcriptional regulator [Clostridiales bacterium]
MKEQISVNLGQIAKELLPRSMAARDWVFQVLRAAIVRGVLPGGIPLRQDEISVALNVSHIPVREAFRQLEAQGLVRIYPNRGAVVTRLTLQEMEDIMDVRAVLEVGALAAAIPLMRDVTIETAQAILDEAHNTTDPHKLEDLNSCFHFTLYEPVQNQTLFKLIEQMHANVDRYIRAYYSEAENHAASKAQHDELLYACKERDIEAARNILYEHISSTKRLLEVPQ